MSNGNSVSLVGNVTRDPELRFTPTGQPNASFGVAVFEPFRALADELLEPRGVQLLRRDGK